MTSNNGHKEHMLKTVLVSHICYYMYTEQWRLLQVSSYTFLGLFDVYVYMILWRPFMVRKYT